MKGFIPHIDFIIDEGHFGLAIICKFDNENDKNFFIRKLDNSLNIHKDVFYLE